MIVGIQSGGIGKVDMSQTGGTTDKSKSKDKASGTFEDLMRRQKQRVLPVQKKQSETKHHRK